MKDTAQTCYMCDAPATSEEHVPPKCLFPERKDLPQGMDLRRIFSRFLLVILTIQESQMMMNTFYIFFLQASKLMRLEEIIIVQR